MCERKLAAWLAPAAMMRSAQHPRWPGRTAKLTASAGSPAPAVDSVEQGDRPSTARLRQAVTSRLCRAGLRRARH